MTIPRWPMITEHQMWQTVRRYVTAKRAHGGSGHYRYELHAPAIVEDRALGMVGQCSHCGARIHYFRRRRGDKAVFLALTCSLDVNMGCARSGDARRASVAVAAAVHDDQLGDVTAQLKML